jgi:hypothetical protein
MFGGEHQQTPNNKYTKLQQEHNVQCIDTCTVACACVAVLKRCCVLAQCVRQNGALLELFARYAKSLQCTANKAANILYGRMLAPLICFAAAQYLLGELLRRVPLAQYLTSALRRTLLLLLLLLLLTSSIYNVYELFMNAEYM